MTDNFSTVSAISELTYLSFVARVFGHRCFNQLFIYLVLILVSCFLVLLSALFRFKLMFTAECGFRPRRSQIVRILLSCISVS